MQPLWRRPPVPHLIAIALGFLMAVIVRYALSNTGDAVAAALLHWPRERLLSAAFKAALALVVLPATFYAWHRLAPGVRPWLPLALVLSVVGSRYFDSIRDNDHFNFAPGIVTLKPNGQVEDHNPNRPQFPYVTNSHGFREPEWPMDKQPGTVRGAILGDSYVFGIGVPFDETLSKHLGDQLRSRHPGRQIEVLNLGMPGNNFASYVDLYEAARARLDLDFVVLCLTMPNDLSRWDWPREWHEAHSVSLYSFARFLLDANVASALWGTMLLEEGVQPAAVTAFRAQSERLMSLRKSTGETPMVVFAYRFQGSPVDESFGHAPHITLIQGRGEDADFIPGDGHPNAIGNMHFAPMIADALDAMPELKARF